jgi:hypothetical protein
MDLGTVYEVEVKRIGEAVPDYKFVPEGEDC